jgi:hypothetical protein
MSDISKIKPIFKDDMLQSLFEVNGFVKVPLLNQEQSSELAALFDQTQNADLIYMVDAKIKSICVDPLEQILTDFKPLVGCFHIKEPGLKSETGIHQDPTFVDEAKYCSANVWIALQDIDEKNGNLFFIKGSNRIPSFRTVPDFPNYYSDFYDSLPEMSIQVSLKKGEAVIFNNSTIHAATKNSSDSIRLAATLLVCSTSAEWLLYYKDPGAPDDKVEEYKLNMDTFIGMAKNGRPDQKSFRQYVAVSFPHLSKNEFLKRTGQDAVNKNYIQKMKGFFGIKNVL